MASESTNTAPATQTDGFSIPALPVKAASKSTSSSVVIPSPYYEGGGSEEFDRAAALRVEGSAEQKDASVQGTSDDAAISKHSAMSLGYFLDDFLNLFVSASHVSRRPPLINRGYWARVAAVNQCMHEFLTYGEDVPTQPAAASPSPAASSPSPSSPSYPSPFSVPSRVPPPPFAPAPQAKIRKQVLSLGAGSDTLYFKLKAANRAPFRYVEVDFPVAVQRKAATIRRIPKLSALVREKGNQVTQEEHERLVATSEARANSSDALTASLALPSSDYTLLGADLRDLAAFERTLREADFDFSIPTLILSECVLIYMPPNDSASLLQFLTQRFTGGCMIFTYEQIHPFDAFGQTMIGNLKNRGCSLLGFTAYPDLIAHENRYKTCGFTHYKGMDMNDIYRYYLKPLSEVKRIERLELFDEFEEWNMIQAHYHISVASKPPTTPPTDEKARALDWAKIGLLGCAKTDARAEHGIAAVPSAGSNSGQVTLPNGKTILLGGAGIRASAPLKPSEGNPNSIIPPHAGSSSGSLKKPSQ